MTLTFEVPPMTRQALDRPMRETTERSLTASSDGPGGGLRAGSQDRHEPGTRPEGGDDLYLTILHCSLDTERALSRGAGAARLLATHVPSRGSPEPLPRR